MDDFIIRYIFEENKDRGFLNSNQFRRYLYERYGIKGRDIGTKIYILINRYQTKKYGRSINPICNLPTREECKRIAQIKRSTKWMKKNR